MLLAPSTRVQLLNSFIAVQILYVKGGAQKVTHNYAESCPDINSLSRFVLLTYMPFGDFLSPLTVTLEGTSKPTTSYLYLNAEHLVTCLDALCPSPAAERKLLLRHGVWALEPSSMLRDRLRQVENIKGPLIEAATAILKESRSKKKRGVDDSIELEPTAKRQRRD